MMMESTTAKNFKPFIAFEGLDGCGKTTQIRKLNLWLNRMKVEHFITREPGGTEVGEELRRILKQYKMNDITQLLLFSASRKELLGKIKETLQEKWVICDRFVYSTWAYQHFSKGIDSQKIKACESIIDLDLTPDIVFFFGHKCRTDTRDILESSLCETALRKGFESFAGQPNWCVVPKGDIKEISVFIQRKVQEKFGILL